MHKLMITAMTLMILAGCKDTSRLQELEDELENTTLIAYQLLDENEKLKKSVSKLGRRKPVVQAQTIIQKTEDQTPPLEESKRKLYVMQMKLMNYQLINETFPETVQELKSVLGTVEVEARSNSNVVHLSRNGRGGWWYDPDEGTLDINSFDR